jgi:hypothetical protein
MNIYRWGYDINEISWLKGVSVGGELIGSDCEEMRAQPTQKKSKLSSKQERK